MKQQGKGASTSGPGSREPDPAVPALSGFDPSREPFAINDDGLDICLPRESITFKSCPFCGGDAGFVIGGHGDGRLTYTVFCDGCHASASTEFSRHCARRNWNRRHRDSDGSPEGGDACGSVADDSAAIAQPPEAPNA